MDGLRAFYTSWGWNENEDSSSEYASFTAGSVRLALYPLDRLADEAAPGEDLPSQGCWSGVTLAINFDSREAVDDAVVEANAAGASVVQPGTTREWGGYSAYVADPEGTRWELAWAPGFEFDAR